MTQQVAADTPQLLAGIYCRMSADREGRELGVARQEEDARVLAERRGAVVADVYIDNDISASTRSRKSRPEYKRMLTDAATGKIQVIIAYTSSRLTRKPREHEDLIELAERHGTQFWYVRSPSFDLNTSAGRRVARILAATDAGEAEDIQERVGRERLQQAKQGKWAGGRRPFGYEADGVTVKPDEADEVRAAVTAVLGGSSLRALVGDLNARGVTTSTGGRWGARELSRVLMRPRNAGLRQHQGKEFGPAIWPAIVREDLWRGAVAILSDPNRRTSPGPARRWLGSGLYRCFCGDPVRVHSPSSSQRYAHPSYTCEAKHVYKTARDVDRLVSAVVVERLGRDDAVDLLAEDSPADIGDALEQAAAARVRLDELAALFAAQVITASQLATGSADLRAQLDAAEEQIAAASRVSVLAGIPLGTSDVAKVWERLPLDRKRAVINRLFTVELWKGHRGRPKGWKPNEPYFDPETVKFYWRDGAA